MSENNWNWSRIKDLGTLIPIWGISLVLPKEDFDGTQIPTFGQEVKVVRKNGEESVETIMEVLTPNQPKKLGKDRVMIQCLVWVKSKE